MELVAERVTDYFRFCRERHLVYLRRLRGHPWPWTEDQVLQTYRFTNVFRELDRTTVWFRKMVRESMRDQPEVLLATAVFRWFNRTEIGNIVFCQSDLLTKQTPFEFFLTTGDASAIHDFVGAAFPRGPYATGAYVISSPKGYDKLTGICINIERFYQHYPWRLEASEMLAGNCTLEKSAQKLCTQQGIAGFMAYEIVCDLLHTDLLMNASDRMTWAHIGPGARRGLNRLCDRSRGADWGGRSGERYRLGFPTEKALVLMQELLYMSCLPDHWPQEYGSWDMRTVEHSLCEFDKYSRVVCGEGHPRQVFRMP